MNNAEIRRAEREISSGKPKPMYLLLGEESWGKERFQHHVRSHLMDMDQTAFNATHLDARESSGVTVVDAAGVLPMMAEFRLITVSDCGIWRAADWRAIRAYAQEPNPTTCLLLDWGSQKVKTSAFQKMPSLTVLNFDKPRSWELAGAIRDMAKKSEVRLQDDAIALIAEYSGDDLGKVQRDLEKLKLFRPDDVVTQDDVAALMGRTRPVVSWELNRFLGRRDLPGALKKLHAILDSGEPLFGVMATISRYVKQLFETKALLIQGIRNPSQICATLHLPKPAVDELLQHQKNFSAVELRQAMTHIGQTDLRLRTMRIDRRLLLDHLITRIVTPTRWTPPSMTRKPNGKAAATHR